MMAGTYLVGGSVDRIEGALVATVGQAVLPVVQRATPISPNLLARFDDRVLDEFADLGAEFGNRLRPRLTLRTWKYSSSTAEKLTSTIQPIPPAFQRCSHE